MPNKKRSDMRREMKKEWKAEWKDGKNSYKYCGWKSHCHSHHGVLGGFWLAGWLFTIGLLKLTFWKAVLALVIWAYYLGSYAVSVWH